MSVPSIGNPNKSIQWCLHCRSPQPLPWSSRRDFRDRSLPYRHPNRFRIRTIMATTLRGTFRHGHRYWSKERHRPYLLRRDGTRSYSRCARHVLAALGRRRYLLGLLRQRYRQGHRTHRVAPPAWICLYSIIHPRSRYLLLPRVSSLAHEAWKVRPRFQIDADSACAPYHRCSRLLLLVCHLRRRVENCRRFNLLHPHA